MGLIELIAWLVVIAAALVAVYYLAVLALAVGVALLVRGVHDRAECLEPAELVEPGP